jgi:hypothetical protein
MHTADRVRISRIAVPLKHFLQGNATAIMEALTKFPRLSNITLLVGDGLIDARYANDTKQERLIQEWSDRVWHRIYRRRIKYPKVRYQKISEERAHFYGIDQFIW